MKTIQYTKQGYKKMLLELEELKKRRPEAVAELKRAREMGDLSENAAYKVARQQVNSIDARIRRLRINKIMGRVSQNIFSGVVEVGTKVTVKQGNDEKIFFLVGDQESNPLEGKISTYSPIGRALFHHREGDRIAIIVPAGTISYTILRVEPA